MKPQFSMLLAGAALFSSTAHAKEIRWYGNDADDMDMAYHLDGDPLNSEVTVNAVWQIELNEPIEEDTCPNSGEAFDKIIGKCCLPQQCPPAEVPYMPSLPGTKDEQRKRWGGLRGRAEWKKWPQVAGIGELLCGVCVPSNEMMADFLDGVADGNGTAPLPETKSASQITSTVRAPSPPSPSTPSTPSTSSPIVVTVTAKEISTSTTAITHPPVNQQPSIIKPQEPSTVTVTEKDTSISSLTLTVSTGSDTLSVYRPSYRKTQGPSTVTVTEEDTSISSMITTVSTGKDQPSVVKPQGPSTMTVTEKDTSVSSVTTTVSTRNDQPTVVKPQGPSTGTATEKDTSISSVTTTVSTGKDQPSVVKPHGTSTMTATEKDISISSLTTTVSTENDQPSVDRPGKTQKASSSSLLSISSTIGNATTLKTSYRDASSLGKSAVNEVLGQLTKFWLPHASKKTKTSQPPKPTKEQPKPKPKPTSVEPARNSTVLLPDSTQWFDQPDRFTGTHVTTKMTYAPMSSPLTTNTTALMHHPTIPPVPGYKPFTDVWDNREPGQHCHGVWGDTWFNNWETVTQRAKEFCAQTKLKKFYGGGTPNDVDFEIIPPPNTYDHTPLTSPNCVSKFVDGLINGCDGNDPVKNNLNQKYGGIINTEDGWSFILRPRTLQQGGCFNARNLYAVKPVAFWRAGSHDSRFYDIRGRNFDPAKFGNMGDGLLWALKHVARAPQGEIPDHCGDSITWNFELTPNDCCYQWHAWGTLHPYKRDQPSNKWHDWQACNKKVVQSDKVSRANIIKAIKYAGGNFCADTVDTDES